MRLLRGRFTVGLSAQKGNVMKMRTRILARQLPALLIALVIATPSLASDFFEAGKIRPSDPQENGGVGRAIALDGEHLLISRFGADEMGTSDGAVIAYRCIDGEWVEQQKLLPSLFEDFASFGGTVALDGNTAMIRSGLDSPTSTATVFVFEFDGTQWIETQILTVSDGQDGDSFASNISLDGTTAAITASGFDGGADSSGAVYVFEYDGTEWVETQKLLPQTPSQFLRFGQACKVDSGNLFITSLAGSETDSGTVHLYRFDGSSWVEIEQITQSDAEPNDLFGFYLDVQGDVAVISSPGKAGNTGAIYLFRFDGTQWNEIVKQEASDGYSGQVFGGGVFLDGDRVLVIASRDDEFAQFSGAAYSYRIDGSSFVGEQKIVSSTPTAFDFFPGTIALEGEVAFLGSPNDDTEAFGAGSVCVFESIRDCMPGTVNAGNGTVLNMLFVGGTAGGADRRIEIGDGDTMEVTITRPPAGGNGKFVLHADFGHPCRTSYAPLPFEIGTTCFPFLLAEGAVPVIVANNLGREGQLGASAFVGNPQPNPDVATTSFSYAPFPFGTTLTFQAVIIDPGSASTRKPVSTTNAVVVRVE